jgi:hypothetical protein
MATTTTPSSLTTPSMNISWNPTAARPLTMTLRYGLMVSLLLLGAVVAAPPVAAEVLTNHHGSVCKPYSWADTASVQYFDNGYHTSASTLDVVCPLTRRTTSNLGAKVYIDITFTAPTGFARCTLYSYSYNGNLLGSAATPIWSGTGFHEFVIDLPSSYSSSISDHWSDYSVICSATAGGLKTVHGVDLQEYE